MEMLEVHSKDFLIRWVHADAGTRVTWKVRPVKRSINFCVYAHSEENSAGSELAKSTGQLAHRLKGAGFRPLTRGGLVRVEPKEPVEGSVTVERSEMLAFVFDNTFSISNSKHLDFSFNTEPLAPAAAFEALASSHGNSSASNNSTGEIGSKNEEKRWSEEDSGLATAAAATALGASHHTDSTSIPRPPSSPHHERKHSMCRPELPTKRRSTISQHGGPPPPNANPNEGKIMKSLDGRFVTGYLQKKRRKNFQGFAQRYFQLDKQTRLLNYYLNNRTSSLRGVMPIKLADIVADRSNLQFTMNSGMEKWTLKCNDPVSFEAWIDEFDEVHSRGHPDESEAEYVADTDSGAETHADGTRLAVGAAVSGAVGSAGMASVAPQVVESKSGNGLRPTMGSKSEMAPLSREIEAKHPSLVRLRRTISQIPEGDVRHELEVTYQRLVQETTKMASAISSTNETERPSAKSPGPSQTTITRINTQHKSKKARKQLVSMKKLAPLELLKQQALSPNFMILNAISLATGAVFGLLFSVLFAMLTAGAAAWGLISFTRKCHAAVEKLPESDEEMSPIERPQTRDGAFADDEDDDDEDDDLSDNSEEEDSAPHTEGVGHVPKSNFSGAATPTVREAPHAPPSSNLSDALTASNMSAHDTTSSHDISSQEIYHEANSHIPTHVEKKKPGEESAENTLCPLPHSPVKRRSNVPGPAQQPPSLMALVKNAKNGNASAPIMSNEPLSGLQTTAELYENSDLLDRAAAAAKNSAERTALVALFSVARVSAVRVKERALRKPFTPLLGETFECVREDLGLRYFAEKVKHKPEVLATQAESANWTAHFTSRPHTKMWTKSVQLDDTGHFNVTFADGESVSFLNPTMYIRNILAGERYIDPEGTTTVESSTGVQATVEYEKGGMFAGRSEKVKITCGKLVYEGKWTESIHRGSEMVWKAKPLVKDAPNHYGWPLFCAQMNEITEIEQGKLPPNDSRLRPDMRLYEKQTEIEKAESLKLMLEQHQRERRADMEAAKKQHEPFFFTATKDAKGHFALFKGERNYWNMRQQQNWSAIPDYMK